MTQSLFERLCQDERVIQAKQLLLDSLADAQSHLQKPSKASHKKSVSYTKLLKQMKSVRGLDLWFPYIGSGPGKGALVELADGHVKYDFICGIGAHWSHSNKDIVESAIDAALQNIVMQGNLQQNQIVVQLMSQMVKASGLDHVFLTSSGAMAVENGLKIAFQHRFPANRILAFEGCFMGRTLALSQITDKSLYRDGLPDTINVDYIPFYDSKNPKESTQNALNTLSQYLQRYPGKYAVMCLEMVQGEGGYNVGSSEFFQAIIDLLKSQNILVLIDEIQTFGRTPELFAHHYFGLTGQADIVTVGKLTQVCATFFNKKTTPRPGLISQTFTSSTSAIFAANTIFNQLLESDFYGQKGQIMKWHRRMVKHLKTIPGVQGPFGLGAMIAFTPFDGSKQTAVSIVKALFDAGLMGFIAGSYPARIRFLLPIGQLSMDDIDGAMSILKDVMLEHQSKYKKFKKGWVPKGE